MTDFAERPMRLSRPGDLQRRLEPLRGKMPDDVWRACYETVTFGRLTPEQRTAVMYAEAGLEPPQTSDTDESGDEVEYADPGA